MSKELPQQQQNSEEVDLGQLFKLIGKMFERLFNFIGSIFNKIFLAFVWCIFFVKQHFLKIVIAGIVGVVLGFALQKTSDPVYKSYMLVKQNYPTGEGLYNSIAYYNDLVTHRDISALSQILEIDSLSAASIKEVEVGSIIDENDRLKNFDDYIKTLDSSVASKVQYETYVKNEKEHNHQFQQITIKSTVRNNFKTLFDKIITNINTNDYFVEAQKRDTLELHNRKLVLQNTLTKSDSLQNVYKRVIEMQTKEQSGSQTSVTIKNAEDVNKTKEYELFLNDLELQREIVSIEREIEEKKKIIEIVSTKQESAGSVDDKKEVFGFKIGYKLYYGLLLSTLTFLVLAFLQFVKYIEKFKDKIQ
ncbi:hypothetical protein FUA26_04120 [Seonamhaeicola algicola]|uniref:Uncharacterized protein n=1 Tax=Seonamhaeicola algicola TaxID=1719036 RepID=A0A5C7AWD0_9FLAO|nr:hypothetical protein [Seonamhaeicola algicola]TXE12988.1 hypothetical protein FUA26_04120 [Seonamhaeicola algicola]